MSLFLAPRYAPVLIILLARRGSVWCNVPLRFPQSGPEPMIKAAITPACLKQADWQNSHGLHTPLGSGTTTPEKSRQVFFLLIEICSLTSADFLNFPDRLVEFNMTLRSLGAVDKGEIDWKLSKWFADFHNGSPSCINMSTFIWVYWYSKVLSLTFHKHA